MNIIISESQLKRIIKEESTIDNNRRNYAQVKNEWSKINFDNMDRRGFGEGVSPKFELAKQMAIQNAKLVLAKKMENYHFKGEIKDTLVKKVNGQFHYMILIYPIMDHVEFGQDAANFVTPGDIYF
jgi:hypothetical protein